MQLICPPNPQSHQEMPCVTTQPVRDTPDPGNAPRTREARPSAGLAVAEVYTARPRTTQPGPGTRPVTSRAHRNLRRKENLFAEQIREGQQSKPVPRQGCRPALPQRLLERGARKSPQTSQLQLYVSLLCHLC